MEFVQSTKDLVQGGAELAALTIEVLGVATIVFFALYALVGAGYRRMARHPSAEIFDQVRQRLGRGVLLGLELLVGADIIHTVAVELSFETVGVLAVVVLIRTWLSFSIEVELTGRWPWQQHRDEKAGSHP